MSEDRRSGLLSGLLAFGARFFLGSWLSSSLSSSFLERFLEELFFVDDEEEFVDLVVFFSALDALDAVSYTHL